MSRLYCTSMNVFVYTESINQHNYAMAVFKNLLLKSSLSLIVWYCLIGTSQTSAVQANQSSLSAAELENPFTSIEPSTELIWTPCTVPNTLPLPGEDEGGDTFALECARLLVR